VRVRFDRTPVQALPSSDEIGLAMISVSYGLSVSFECLMSRELVSMERNLTCNREAQVLRDGSSD
jgi:hypothetical protein